MGRNQPQHRLPLQGATEPPPRPRYRRRASVLDPYLPYLVRRWNEGCRSAKRLHREIRELGYRHSIDTVNRLLSSFRHTEEQGEKIPHAPRAKRGSIAGASPTAKNVAALFMRREEMLNGEQKAYLEGCAPPTGPSPTPAA